MSCRDGGFDGGVAVLLAGACLDAAVADEFFAAVVAPAAHQEVAMSSEGLHAPRERVSKETLATHQAITSLMEELQAIDWYRQRADEFTIGARVAGCPWVFSVNAGRSPRWTRPTVRGPRRAGVVAPSMSFQGCDGTLVGGRPVADLQSGEFGFAKTRFRGF